MYLLTAKYCLTINHFSASLVPGVFVDDSDGTVFYALGYFDPMNPFICDLSLAMPVNL